MPSRRYSPRPARSTPPRNCKKHPNVPAVAGTDLCQSCRHFAEEAKARDKAGKTAS